MYQGSGQLGGNAMIDMIIREAADYWPGVSHGDRGAFIDAAAERCGRSRQTVYRLIKQCLAGITIVDAAGKPVRRKRRSDAGNTCITREELEIIAAAWRETYRANGKRLAALEALLVALRADGKIFAGRVDETTGEFKPLSASQVARLLKQAKLHPGQMMQPTPKVELASAHPNHVWQIDASLCVLYYLKHRRGLQVMPEDEFNKNKPKNLKRIEQDRVWRYVVVDHASGAVYVEYVFGAESSRNISQCFINAMQYRGPEDPFHGVPRILMMDKGSANIGSMFTNLCAALRVDTWTNKKGKPWGKGSVEKGNDIVERNFEWRLKFMNVDSLEALNVAAWQWMRDFNAHATHTRHGKTRYAAWMTITPAQLVEAPDVARCMSLANSAAVERLVSPLQRVHFLNRFYDVSGVPGREIGQKLLIARNAFGGEFSAQALGHDEDDNEVWCTIEPLGSNELGFTNRAVPIGTFRTAPETEVDANRKALERRVMGAATDEEAESRRSAKAKPFDGQFNPLRPIEDAPGIAHLPRKGTPAQVDAPRTIDAPPMPLPANPEREFPPVSQAEACKRLKPMVEKRGGHWSAWCWNRVAERFPQGVPFDGFETFADELAQATRLRVVDNSLPRAAGGEA